MSRHFVLVTTTMDMDLENICLRLFDVGALKFGNFVLKSGAHSPVYFDLRVMISHPQLMNELACIVHRTVKQSKLTPDVICGVPYTALPVASLLSVKMGIPLILRRKEPKKHGTMKLIEGIFEEGNVCLIIEDVVVSGDSILETAKDLRKDGLIVQDVIIMVDRQQGSQENLTNENINIHSLLTFCDILDILQRNNKLNQVAVDSAKKYISENQFTAKSNVRAMGKVPNRLAANLKGRADLADNVVTKRLLKIMEDKQTNLCLACDVTTSRELLRFASELGEFICLLKTHYDIVSDWDENVEKQLRDIAQTKNFLVFEDRKFSDTGNIMRQQSKKVFQWADIVTLHSTAGPKVIDDAQEAAKSSCTEPRGAFLVAQLSSSGCLTGDQYCQATVDMTRERTHFLVGLVAQQSTVVSDSRLVQLTPGVGLSSGTDNLGQNYVSPESAVLDKGADVIVVGRSILNSPEPKATAKEISSRAWVAFLQRISNS